jgi:membrane-bound serine protease (ClpP class)
LLPLLCAALVLAASAAGASRAAAPGVTHIRIEGAIDVGTLALTHRAIDGARERGDRLLVEIDTPGGSVEVMWTLAHALDEASENGLQTVAWVNTRAHSAGALVAMSCDKLFVRAASSVGSALPVTIGPGGLMPVSEDQAVREKLTSALRSEFRGWAEDHGRPGLLAEAMVDPEVEVRQIRRDGELVLVSRNEWEDIRTLGQPGELVRTICAEGELLNLTGSEALALGLADGVAETLDDVLDKSGMSGRTPTFVERASSDDMAALLDQLWPLLLIGALLFAYLEIKAPGFSVPGVLSIVCLTLLLFGRWLAGLADVPEVVLVVVGVALVAVEVFVVPGTTWVGLLGAVSLAAGLFMSLVEVGGLEYGLDRRIVMGQAFALVVTLFVGSLALWGLAAMLPRTPILQRLVSIPAESAGGQAAAMPHARGAHAAVAEVGATGRALTALRPVGKVALDVAPDLEFEARSSGPELAADAAVRVVEVRAGRLVVELAEEA